MTAWSKLTEVMPYNTLGIGWPAVQVDEPIMCTSVEERRSPKPDWPPATTRI